MGVDVDRVEWTEKRPDIEHRLRVAGYVIRDVDPRDGHPKIRLDCDARRVKHECSEEPVLYRGRDVLGARMEHARFDRVMHYPLSCSSCDVPAGE
jgi:hypothetical protein